MSTDEKAQSESEDAKTDELIDAIKGASEKKEETSETKDEKSEAAAENSDEEKKQVAEDDKKKSVESEKDSGKEEGKKENEDKKPPDEWQKKFDDQTKNFQETMKEKSEDYYQTKKELVENSPEHLVRLANSSKDDDVKLANRLSKEIYDLPLEDALATIKKSRSDAGEEEETRDERDVRIANETQRSVVNENAYESFNQKHPILDSDSEEFDSEVKEKFDKKFSTLSGDGKMLKEDFKEALSDAYSLATKDLKAKTEKKDADDAQKKIGETGAGGGTKKLDSNEKKDDMDGLCDNIRAVANPKK